MSGELATVCPPSPVGIFTDGKKPGGPRRILKVPHLSLHLPWGQLASPFLASSLESIGLRAGEVSIGRKALKLGSPQALKSSSPGPQSLRYSWDSLRPLGVGPRGLPSLAGDWRLRAPFRAVRRQIGQKRCW